MIAFQATLSAHSVYQRYFTFLELSHRIAEIQLHRICSAHSADLTTVIAEQTAGLHRILGVGSLGRVHQTSEAEFAILVSDEYQGQGLGTELLRTLVELSISFQFTRITGNILSENRVMQRIAWKLGFQVWYSSEEQLVKAVLEPTGKTGHRDLILNPADPIAGSQPHCPGR